MKTRNCEVIRFGNEDWFSIIRSNKSLTPIEYYLYQLNLDEWYIYKMTGNFRRADINELLEFKYAGYIFFNKKFYDYIIIDEWIEFYYKELKLCGGSSGGSSYLSKPFPPIYIKNKVRIKQ
jgi:hypothetical protein